MNGILAAIAGSPYFALAINAWGFINRAMASGVPEELKARYDELVAQFNAELPAKDDGTPWTSADIDAIAAEHAAYTQQIRDRHQG